MKYLIIIYFIISNTLNAEELSWNFISMITKVHETILPSGVKYLTFKSTGGSTLNTGKYGLSSCSGFRADKDKKALEVRAICNTKIDDGNEIWSELRRDRGVTSAGVGKTLIVDATGPYKVLINKECTYALSYYDKLVFGKTKCKITKELFNKLNK